MRRIKIIGYALGESEVHSWRGTGDMPLATANMWEYPGTPPYGVTDRRGFSFQLGLGTPRLFVPLADPTALRHDDMPDLTVLTENANVPVLREFAKRAGIELVN